MSILGSTVEFSWILIGFLAFVTLLIYKLTRPHRLPHGNLGKLVVKGLGPEVEACIQDVSASFSAGLKQLLVLIQIIKQLPVAPSRGQVDSKISPIKKAAFDTWLHFRQAAGIVSKHREKVDRSVEKLVQLISESEQKCHELQENLKRQEILHAQVEEEGKKMDRELKEAEQKVIDLGGTVRRADQNAENYVVLLQVDALAFTGDAPPFEKAAKASAVVSVYAVAVTGAAVLVTGPVGVIATGIGALLGLGVSAGVAVSACKDLENAKNALKLAESKKASTHEKQKKTAERVKQSRVELEALERTIDKANPQLKLLRQEQGRISKCAEWIRNCSTYLELALGKAEVMKGTTKSVYSFEPLINVLGNLVTHLDQGPGRQLAESCINRLTREHTSIEAKIRAVATLSKQPLLEEYA